MEECFPGTVVPRAGRSAKDLFDGLFIGTNGLLLMQIRELTGLETPVIQNWINREFVPRPVKKRYGALHLGRILIVNMLRSTAKMDDIGRLLRYINGDTNNQEDDILGDDELYIALCDVIDRTAQTADEEAAIAQVARQCHVASENRRQLTDGLRVLLRYYRAAVLKAQADLLLISLPDYAGRQHGA